MNILILLKSDSVYTKIQKSLGQKHDLSRNIAYLNDLQEFLLSEEADIAILEEGIHWRQRAMQLLKAYDIPIILFDGNFDELESKINGVSGQSGLKVSSKVVVKEDGGEGAAQPAASPEVAAASTGATKEGEVADRPAERIVYVDRPVEVIREIEVPVIKEIEKEVIREVEKEVIREVTVEKLVDRPVEVIREVERTIEKLQVLSNRLIIIGGLYPGAGSSFVSMALARVLNHLSIPHALVESPVHTPELFHRLDGSRKAPGGGEFIYLTDYIKMRDGMQPAEWADGLTTWVPCNPKRGVQEDWTYEQTMQLILAVRAPVVILDVSHRWDHPSVQKVCNDADEIIFVADNRPEKYERGDTHENVAFMGELQKKRKSVSVIANRDFPTPRKGYRLEWMKSLPILPIAIVPDMEYSKIIEAEWEGRLVYDDEAYLDRVVPSMYPFIRRIIPTAQPIKLNKTSGNILTRLFRRGK